MRRFIGLSTTKGAVRPSHRSPAMKVWVFQCPNGAFERSRWPFGHRPRRRVILVVVPVSSMNTRRWGSSRILGWRFAFHSWRARSEEHTSELQSRENLVCRLLLEKKKDITSRETNSVTLYD